jgi:hypothetical protein
VNCPFECEFLQQARLHDKLAPLDPDQVPNREIQVTERFLADNEALVSFLGAAIGQSALSTAGAVDNDVREAVSGLVQTYRTLGSGVYYEAVPQNPLAANVFRMVQRELETFRQEETRRLGMSKTRDSDVLKVLVFFQRVELDRNNGRPRGRAFLNALFDVYGARTESVPSERSSLILP